MPRRAPSVCAHPGCNVLVADGGRCAAHVAESRRQYDAGRGSAANRGYDSRWRQYREQYLREHPLCVKCQDEGLVTAAVVVDHKVPHRGDRGLFWATENHQPLCTSHHSQKTAADDGGFGNAAAG